MNCIKLDDCFARELRKEANGDGSREAKFAFKDKVTKAAKELSTSEVPYIFSDVIKKYGRVPIAICVAVTIVERRDRLDYKTVCWANEVLKLWTNQNFSSYLFAYINDGLHPTRIEEYAGSFIRLTTGSELYE